MTRAVADTHAIVWWAFDDPRLSAPARQVFLDAAAARDHVIVSSISLVEIAYLVERGRIDPTTFGRVTGLIDARLVVREIPVHRRIADVLRTIDRAHVPDMPDRIIAATAVHLGVPVLTRDARIIASGIPTTW